MLRNETDFVVKSVSTCPGTSTVIVANPVASVKAIG